MPRDPAEQFIERMGGALTNAGLPRLPSRVFAALCVDEDGRMTAAELGETLEVSPAAVSGAVKFLAQIHFVHRERERGSRRDVYVVDDDALHSALLSKDTLYAPMFVALDDAVDGLEAGSDARHRLMLMREFLAFVDTEMTSMATRWEKRRGQIERELRRS
ncbi:GbsR/MarR family transcriptional regulator [Nocardioides sp. LHG3406-4]|uniref:GbsR/MarR family transcriptional regulator n=1 Tax=Nocardioides sp. LHG3406-4 TaxID=2804575 RepID=UPI003CFA384D